MTLTLSVPEQHDFKPRITVFGVGGAGGNAVNNMIRKELAGVDFVVANTDAQALEQMTAQKRIQLGVKATQGLGAGARPAVGAAAAEESIDEIVDHLTGTHMCFITAGMGGGTGTGAAPIVAQAARSAGVLTVGVVTKPFSFEGSRRMRLADEGIEELQRYVDTLIIIPNQNLFRLANESTTFAEAFALADDVLYQGVQGVTDLMVRPGMMNLDFADVRAVMDEMGKAMMGTGEAEGENRAKQAAEKAIANPLLDDISLEGAKGVLINVIASEDMTLFEIDEATNMIRDRVDPDANIIVGSTLDPSMDGKLRVSIVATGIDAQAAAAAKPTSAPRADPVAVAVETAVEAPSYHEEAPAVEAVAQEHSAAPQPVEDDLPQPVYEPRVATFEPRQYDEVEEQQAERADEAARYADAGPSDATLARLHAAVMKNPNGRSEFEDSSNAPLESDAEGGEERSRFAINTLIDRMTRQQGAEEEAAAPAPAAPRRPSSHRDAEAGAEDRVEVPAFLRRQAN